MTEVTYIENKITVVLKCQRNITVTLVLLLKYRLKHTSSITLSISTAFSFADTSGIRLYYTKHMRNYEVGNVQIGQNDLEIPAGSRHLLQSGSCSSTCTKRMLPHPIYLTKTYIHMHNMGRLNISIYHQLVSVR